MIFYLFKKKIIFVKISALPSTIPLKTEVMNMYGSKGEMKVPSRVAPPPPTYFQRTWKSSMLVSKETQIIHKGQNVRKKPPPRPPPPKFLASNLTENKGSQMAPGVLLKSQCKGIDGTASLIDWSSPPSSPTSTTRSSSDALSLNSFGSDSINPSSENMSNVESGFEDDFDLFGAAPTKATDPWSPVPTPQTFFSKRYDKVSLHPSIQQSMPTIIRVKPERPKVSKILEKRLEMDALAEVFKHTRTETVTPAAASRTVTLNTDDDSWSCDSPPMPTYPPPSPPHELLEAEKRKTTAIALFDYTGDSGDLSFRFGDRLEIIRRIDDNWAEASLRGVIGTVPTNFIQIERANQRIAIALYPFAAVTWEDLSLEQGEEVLLLGRINSDWLFGQIGNRRGQFPSNFVDHVPSDLPAWTS